MRPKNQKRELTTMEAARNERRQKDRRTSLDKLELEARREAEAQYREERWAKFRPMYLNRLWQGVLYITAEAESVAFEFMEDDGSIRMVDMMHDTCIRDFQRLVKDIRNEETPQVRFTRTDKETGETFKQNVHYFWAFLERHDGNFDFVVGRKNKVYAIIEQFEQAGLGWHVKPDDNQYQDAA